MTLTVTLTGPRAGSPAVNEVSRPILRTVLIKKKAPVTGVAMSFDGHIYQVNGQPAHGQ